MKTNMMMAAMASMALAAAVQAAEPSAAEEFTPSKAAAVAKAALTPVRGGIYELQPQLKAVDAGAAGGPVLAQLGSKVVVKASTPVAKPGAGPLSGAVVKNRLTGELAYYSGHLTVLLKDRQRLQALQQKFGLRLVRAVGDQGLVILKAGPEADLQALKAGIAATGWVREVKLDLVDKRNVPY
jgi:hypothetical protein